MTRYHAARYNTVSFGLQFCAVSVGAFTDFLVGKLTNELSLAVFGWLVAYDAHQLVPAYPARIM